MRYRYVAVAFVAVVALCAGHVAANPPSNIDGHCKEGDDEVLVFVEGEESQPFNEETALYPETTVYVAYCGNNGAERPTIDDQTIWSISPESGITNPEELEYTYRVSLPDDQEEVTLNSETIEQKSPANTLTISIQRGPGIQSELTNTRLSFQEGNVPTYRAYETAYLETEGELDQLSSRLNQTIERIDSGGASAFVMTQSETESLLEEMSQNLTEMNENANQAYTLLYAHAANSNLPPGDHTAALEALDKRKANTQQKVNASIAEYNQAAQSIEQTAKQTVRTNVLVSLIPAFLFGGAIGGYYITRYGRKTEDFSDFQGSDFEASLLVKSAVGGLTLLIIGVISLIITGVGGVMI